jgi:hypothetical protein
VPNPWLALPLAASFTTTNEIDVFPLEAVTDIGVMQRIGIRR